MLVDHPMRGSLAALLGRGGLVSFIYELMEKIRGGQPGDFK